MKNDLPVSLAGLSGPAGCLRSSEPLASSPVPAPASSLLEEAADLLVVHRDFAAALDRCERGCESLAADPESESSMEMKCSLCIVGIQALAEMNRWREVLSWVLQYYEVPERLPPKILELCILLYSKVKEPHVMLEVDSYWLRDLTNQSLPSYGTLMELHLLHVLLPLGQFVEAEELVQGSEAFNKEQQLEALRTINERRSHWVQQEETQSAPEEQPATVREKLLGSVSRKFLTMLTALHRALGSMSSHFCSSLYKKLLLVACMLCLVLVRLDPAAPTSLPFLHRLVQLCHQAWVAVFSPRHRPSVEN
uniref:Peroxisomal biogenesis factor 26 n=1 Tax=Pelusios castaneus TaxID=367368 RepID=A0A8C8SLK2_9SAUR